MVSSSLAIIGREKILWNFLLEIESRLSRSASVFSSPTLPSNLPGHAPGDYHVNFIYVCVFRKEGGPLGRGGGDRCSVEKTFVAMN